MKRKLFALILALLLCQGLIVPALAVVEEIASVKVDDVTGYSQSDSVYTVLQDGLYGFYRTDGTVLGEAGVAANTSGEDSRLNLELLFNAVTSDRRAVASLLENR